MIPKLAWWYKDLRYFFTLHFHRLRAKSEKKVNFERRTLPLEMRDRVLYDNINATPRRGEIYDSLYYSPFDIDRIGVQEWTEGSWTLSIRPLV